MPLLDWHSIMMLPYISGVCRRRGAAVESVQRGTEDALLCFRSFGRLFCQENKKAEKQHINRHERAFPLVHGAVVVDVGILVIVKLVDTHGNSCQKQYKKNAQEFVVWSDLHGFFNNQSRLLPITI